MRQVLTQPLATIMPILCGLAMLTTVASQAQVSGTVFKDFNANGTQQNTTAYSEPGFAGVTVVAYNPAGGTLTVTYTGGGTSTNTTGGYAVTGGTLGQIRLEFILPDGFTFASNGATGGTTVMFPTGATQNLAVNYPDDYWNNATQPVPQLLVPCYVNGTATVGGTNTGIVQIGNDQNGISGLTMSQVAPTNEVGTTWGNAFQKSKNRFFFSAFLKRQAGFGPRGPGGVYIAELNGAVYDIVAGFSLEGVTPSNSGTPIAFGSVTRSTTVGNDNYLANASGTEPSIDLDAFAKVGTISYGDIDIDEANQALFMTNLNQRSIIKVNISGTSASLNNATAATLGPLTSVYPIASLPGVPTCTSGTLRIWGLKIYKGRGYLGAICDASTSQSQANLTGYILSFDPNNVAAGFTTVLTLDMSYRNPSGWQNWHAWASTWAQTSSGGGFNYYYYQQPIISDIEFNENGDMSIAITDRWGHQMGANNYQPLSGSTTLIRGVAFGDILQARKNATGTWVMEGTAGVIPPNHTSSISPHFNTQTGYGNFTGTPGEYFNDRSGDGSQEGAMGSIAKIMGTNVVVATNVDPYPVSDNSLTPYYDTGGLHWYNTTNGNWDQHARLYGQNYGGTFGKAIGLGDIEANLGVAPLEIGNRVWADTDYDGIQDAGEAGIGNVTINLYASNGTTLLGTTTTDAGGNWYFNTANVTDGDLNTTGNQAGPQPNTTYIIRVGTADWAGGIGAGDLAGRALTLLDVGGAGQPNLRD
ncbi:MAG TPA: SdrD B-like domain-containing protein, partial [Tenuifilaceae bacterium]|nr:SdrD B-like domain-containing protein [Tenuifilaceae bacterium]